MSFSQETDRCFSTCLMQLHAWYHFAGSDSVFKSTTSDARLVCRSTPLSLRDTSPHCGRQPRPLEFIRWKIPVKYEKQRIDSAALHRISCSCVGSLSSVALFRCIFSFGTFFGFIRVYTVVFSDPGKVTLRSQLRCGIAFSSPKTRFKLFPN